MRYSFKGTLDSGIYEARLSFITRNSNDENLSQWTGTKYELSDEKVLIRLDEKNPNYVTLYGTSYEIPIVWYYEEDIPYVNDYDRSQDRDHSYTYFSRTKDKKTKEPYTLALVLIRRVRYENLKKVKNDVYYQDGEVPKNLLYLNKLDLENKLGDYLEMLRINGGTEAYIKNLEYVKEIKKEEYKENKMPSAEESIAQKNYEVNYSEYYDASLAKFLKKDQ